jgi:hypothetical protein
MRVNPDVVAGDQLHDILDDGFDLVRQRAAVGVAQHHPARAGVVGSLRAGERIFLVVFIAVEEMLAVDQRLATGFDHGLDGFADAFEIFLGLDFERDADLKRGRLRDKTDGVRFRSQRARERGVVRGGAARALGHAEGGELGLGLVVFGEQRGVGRVSAGDAGLDVIDAELIQHLGDAELVGHREINAVHLRAVAQRRVEQIEPLFHRLTLRFRFNGFA